jgi:hypothetical protein
MEHNEGTQPERRREPRIEAVGKAIVHGELPALRARIVDISVGGMLVQLARLTGLEAWLDRAVAVDIRIDGHARRWLTAIGRIRRLEINTCRMAVHFDTVPTELQDLLAAETIASNDRDLQPHVILIHKTAELREGIARSFRAAGCSVMEVSSTLEALVQLGRSRYAPELIVLGDAMPEHLAEELRDFLMDEHPGARVVAMDGALDSIDSKVLRLIDQALS